MARAIEACLPGATVEHVGSTSVPGCAGKGTIDLMLLYPPGQLEAAREALDQLGFQRQVGRNPFPEERPMRTGAVEHEGRTYLLHVHVLAAHADEADDLRYFRERLRRDAALVRQYVRLKTAIVADGVSDPADYTTRKADFIRTVLAERE